jgi:hypothetical protein
VHPSAVRFRNAAVLKRELDCLLDTFPSRGTGQQGMVGDEDSSSRPSRLQSSVRSVGNGRPNIPKEIRGNRSDQGLPIVDLVLLGTKP